ncbi:hypothetical protein SAMN05216360_111202 [Methylobacterium phyllostachyos]|uniref:Uncharacterized protein n=1 Tax=Methylobacterium phyllostachyos TaxID=582672 RepID=A0A1H0EJ22_9HYPH|nr:hypothetical protein SAMN05216360_111202 [Methylobacterium phyllostachyos]
MKCDPQGGNTVAARVVRACHTTRRATDSAQIVTSAPSGSARKVQAPPLLNVAAVPNVSSMSRRISDTMKTAVETISVGRERLQPPLPADVLARPRRAGGLHAFLRMGDGLGREPDRLGARAPVHAAHPGEELRRTERSAARRCDRSPRPTLIPRSGSAPSGSGSTPSGRSRYPIPAASDDRQAAPGQGFAEIAFDGTPINEIPGRDRVRDHLDRGHHQPRLRKIAIRFHAQEELCRRYHRGRPR